MNKIKKLGVAGLILAALSFIGCDFGTKKATAGKVYVSFQLESGVQSRSAIPEGVDWKEYSYTLSAIEGYGTADAKAETTLYTSKSYSELATAVGVNPVNYRFTMTAYKATTPVWSGVSDVDLSTGAKGVAFRMYPVSGVTGTAEITINLPDDGVISAVKCGWSENPAVEYASTSKRSELSITETDTGRKAVYSMVDLTAGITQFAMIYMYDENGGLIASLPEALIIVGGKTSKSTIDITETYYNRFAVSATLMKDNKKWQNSEKEISLVEQTKSTEYVLKETFGVFTGTVAKGTYDVCIDGIETGLVFDSATKSINLDFYTITMNPGAGVVLSPVSGAENFFGTLVIQKGKSFVYRPALKNGYTTPSSFKVTTNGTEAAASFGNNITCANVTAPVTISTTGAATINYTITYNVTSADGTWQAGANKPSTFNVSSDVDLPTAADLIGNGKILDGWKLSPDATTAIGYIKADTIYENITLYPVWKDSAYVDTASKIIYANGISLIIQEEGSATTVYLDLNRNGEIDDTETQLVAANGSTDFTDYELRAENKDKKPVASDFTFTMTGGQIASIKGLGAEADNRSILNISGTAKIGSYTKIKNEKKDESEDDTYSYTNVKGVDLSSIYNEWVVVNGQMSGDYKVVLITQYEYNANIPHYVGEIGDSGWADFSNFECFRKLATNTYESSLLTMKSDGDKTIIRLANPDPIAMPAVSGDDAIIGSLMDGFSLGDDRISTECSVFSVSVKNGSFTVPASELEGGTQYLAQTSATSYATTLSTTKSYIYIHILSETNSITAEAASEFLSGMMFRRNANTPDTPVTIKVNLETVSMTDIQNAANGIVKDKDGNSAVAEGETISKFAYFDGSFYMGVSKSNCNWIDSYNNAKIKRFNNLPGYLINITSDVENNYIYKQLGLGQAWTGGARYDTAEDHENCTGLTTCDPTKASAYHVVYDSLSREKPISGFRTDSPYYRWQAGPEAGQIITEGYIPDRKLTSGTTASITTPAATSLKSSSSLDSFANKDIYLMKGDYIIGTATAGTASQSGSWLKSYSLAISNVSLNGGCAISSVNKIALVSGANITTASSTGTGTFVKIRDRMYANWDNGEPNDSFSGPTSEECIHYKTNGKWNDYNWDRSSEVNGYIVEFTQYGTLQAAKQAITKSADY